MTAKKFKSAREQPESARRFHVVTEEKAEGAIYTPKVLADFVARQIVQAAGRLSTDHPLRILDPAIGHGELLVSLVQHLADQPDLNAEIHGFETDPNALDIATQRLEQQFPGMSVHFRSSNFLEFILEHFGPSSSGSLFRSSILEQYDLVIANPPYVRTQILGSKRAQTLAKQFGLSGRVDLYYAFILSISRVLRPNGLAGIIVSNRFMTTKSGAAVREALLDRFNILHAWDLGDTKLFEAAVLPAVLLVELRNGRSKRETPDFTSIYQTAEVSSKIALDPIKALDQEGVVRVQDGRHFNVQHGTLDTNGTRDGTWRIATEEVESWLSTVDAHSWGSFRDIGKVRVGVKTCADRIFIRTDWQDSPASDRPELLKPITTHHVGRRFKPLTSECPSQILYPHEVFQGRRRAVDLDRYPRSRAYLEAHRSALESRRYIIAAGRKWYEVWVPQDPAVWNQTKLVFRDIAEKPTFWMDLGGSVINGDCYWLTSSRTDLLWLAAAVGNSTLIERFYDFRFQNKLYAGRRRFITQYVEKFPVPNPHSSLGRAIIAKSKQVYERTPSLESEQLQRELDALVWKALTGKSATLM